MTHRMFVVEDHEGTRCALQAFFTRMGWQVSVAGTVAEGIALLDFQGEPCCLILDLELPDGPGREVLGRLRAKSYKTRVVVSSGSLTALRTRELANLEPDAFLPKPIAIDDVWDDLCRVCSDDKENEIAKSY
jgi:DNA-binding NtrC family response regulator